MKYQTVIFDFDGTLADTSQGILNCHKYAHHMMGRPEPTEEMLRGVIGGPLLQTYRTVFNFPEADARKAVAYYRQRYVEQGLYEIKLYPGMKMVLETLKKSGCRLGIATLKAECFLDTMLRNMEIQNCFDAVFGMNNDDSRTKAQLIKLCIHKLCSTPRDAILVGDSVYDRDGAQCAGIDFLGVTYGFGFTKGTIAVQANAIAMADDCTQLLKWLI